jgi:predicted DCC family thiol-disulfide oxidoreductase YuxK
MGIVDVARAEADTLPEEAPEIVFYDGNCGLCHHAVRFLLDADEDGSAFVYAPLFGETFAREVASSCRASVPDSLVLKTREGRVLTRSDAVLWAMSRLGTGYRTLARIGGLVPRVLRDFLYDTIAKIRHKLFKKPEGVCPLVPAALRHRFLP